MDPQLLADPSTTTEATSLVDHLWEWLLGSGVTILVIVLVAALLRIVAAWLIRRLFRTALTSGTAISTMTNAVVKRDRLHVEQAQERREQRAETLATVSVNITSLVIVAIALVMILSELGVNVSPIIASLGVAGLAAGIGAQTIIKDVVAGVVMLFEDIVAVGDVVDLEHATGTVVNINLRVTQVRALDGVLWTVRNGEIVRVGNMSRGFSNAVVLLDIANTARNSEVTRALEQMIAAFTQDPEWSDLVLDEPVLSGILSVDGARFQRRVVVKVRAGKQWQVEQELRRRVRDAFSEAGIDFAMPRFVDHAK